MIIASIILALWQPATSAGDFEGCIDIQGGKCYRCYLRKMDPSTGGCGPLVPESDPCAYYSFNIQGTGSQCAYCKTGYAFDDRKPEGKKCIPSTLSKSCILAAVVNNKETCFSCKNGYVLAGQSDCTPASQVKNADPNCLWGRSANKNYSTCSRCKLGFAASFNKLKCAPFTKGCLLFRKSTKECLACDVFDGYFADFEGKPVYCKKQ